MASVTATNPKNGFVLKAYAGDNKTLLAFNFGNKQSAANLAGFSIQAQPPGKPAYFLLNDLLFSAPNKHAVDQSEPPNSSVNAPFQKYRWTHFTGQYHQGLNPAVGSYRYTVTPRYFDNNGDMLALDNTLSASLTINVGPFKKGSLSLGFTRGYMQSQAFEHHFGMHALLMPAGKPLQFDTSTAAGTDSTGKSYTYEDEYAWMGESARVLVFDVLNQVLNDRTLTLKVFAYDLNEPDVVGILLKLAAAGRVRVILDDAKLHTDKANPTPEDQFTTLFDNQKTGTADIVRGHFARFSHDKIFIVSKNGSPIRVLTGSTNFSVTGLYVNANHVLVFDDATVAGKYSQVFEESWNDLSKTKPANAFAGSALATTPFTPQVQGISETIINFSPHSSADASKILNGIVTRVNQETGAGIANGSVIFAVMQLTGGNNNPVYDALNKIHESASAYSYGISDAPAGVFLFQPSSPQGVLVTGKPGKTTLPPPFNQVPSPPGHEIHDKFVVCGLNSKDRNRDAVVYCGSSNLALGGEESNGDNLLEIHDGDVATAFAIEALGLIDHYNFLDRFATAKAAKKAKQPAAKKTATKKGPAVAVAAKKTAKANAKKPIKRASKKVPAPKAAKKSQTRRPAKTPAKRAKKK
jgi:hypothetical protein